MFLGVPYVEEGELAILVGGERHAAAEVDGPEEDGRRGDQAQQPHEPEDRKPYRRRRRHRPRWRDREIDQAGIGAGRDWVRFNQAHAKTTPKSVQIGLEHELEKRRFPCVEADYCLPLSFTLCTRKGQSSNEDRGQAVLTGDPRIYHIRPESQIM